MRITGFARFVLFLIIVVPLTYIGVSYYKGEDGLQNIKDLLGIEQQPTEKKTVDPTVEEALLEDQIRTMEAELEAQQGKIEEMEAEVQELKEMIQLQKEQLTEN